MKTIIAIGEQFIGSTSFAWGVEQQNVRVINLDKLTYAGNLESLADIVQNDFSLFIKGSINDHNLVSDILLGINQMLWLLLRLNHVDRSIDGPGAYSNEW